jgi:hypothetical protein
MMFNEAFVVAIINAPMTAAQIIPAVAQLIGNSGFMPMPAVAATMRRPYRFDVYTSKQKRRLARSRDAEQVSEPLSNLAFSKMLQHCGGLLARLRHVSGRLS